MSLVHGRLTKGDENKDDGCSRKREKRDGRINHDRDVVADKNRKRTGEKHPSRCSIFLSFVDFDFHRDSMNALSTGYWGRKDRNRIKGNLRERVEGKIIKVNNKVKIIKRAFLYA